MPRPFPVSDDVCRALLASRRAQPSATIATSLRSVQESHPDLSTYRLRLVLTRLARAGYLGSGYRITARGVAVLDDGEPVLWGRVRPRQQAAAAQRRAALQDAVVDALRRHDPSGLGLNRRQIRAVLLEAGHAVRTHHIQTILRALVSSGRVAYRSFDHTYTLRESP